MIFRASGRAVRYIHLASAMFRSGVRGLLRRLRRRTPHWHLLRRMPLPSLTHPAHHPTTCNKLHNSRSFTTFAGKLQL